MKIIAIEGLDKSGKKSQSDLLLKYLDDLGCKVMKSEFHRYDTPTGELVMKWLRNEWDVSQETIELIMTADKQAQQEWFLELEKDGYDYLILDRYTTSQLVYSYCNGVNPMWSASLQANMRQPDIEILIDIPAEVSMSRKGKHGDNDRYESDVHLLDSVRQRYLNVFKRPNKFIVSGLNEIGVVHSEIVTKLEELVSK